MWGAGRGGDSQIRSDWAAPLVVYLQDAQLVRAPRRVMLVQEKPKSMYI